MPRPRKPAGNSRKKKAKKKSGKAKSRRANTQGVDNSLTLMQERFVDEYLVDLNATQAAIRAGYSKKTASQQAGKLKRSKAVQKAIVGALAARSKRTRITADHVLEELWLLMRSSIKDYEVNEDGELVVKEGVPAEAIRAVSGFKKTNDYDFDGDPKNEKVDFRLWDKPKVLALAMKHLGMLSEKLELDVKGGVTVYIPDNRRDGD